MGLTDACSRAAPGLIRALFHDRIYNISERRRFVRWIPKGGVGCELGVFEGAFSELLISKARPKELHLIDAWWTKYGTRFQDWGLYSKHGKMITYDAYERATKRVGRFRDKCKIQFHIGHAIDQLKQLPDAYFDWVYIDTTHSYEGTRAELETIKSKIKMDGIICGDDWNIDASHRHHGVYKAVNEFLQPNEFVVVYTDSAHQWAIRSGNHTCGQYYEVTGG